MNLYNLFWGVDYTGRPLLLFSKTHILSLFISLLSLILIIMFRDKIRTSRFEKLIRNILGYGLILSQVLMYIWYFHTGWFNIHDSLPLYISRLSAILAGIMIIKKSEKLFDIMYFWGIVPPLIALLLPDIDYFSFPHIRFWFFYIGHAFTILAVVYMMSVEHMKPNFNSLKRAVKWFLIYSGITLLFNVLSKSNYGYYMKLPPNMKAYNALLPWPVYLIGFIGFQILIFYLLYLPYRKNDKKENSISI